MWEIEGIHKDLSLCEPFQKSRRHPDEVINDMLDNLEKAMVELKRIIKKEEKAVFRFDIVIFSLFLLLIALLVYKHIGK
jgi:hypothetical protein